jgi:hypothetical protein
MYIETVPDNNDNDHFSTVNLRIETHTTSSSKLITEIHEFKHDAPHTYTYAVPDYDYMLA